MSIATLNNSNSITKWVTRTNDLINVVNALDADQAITTQRIADEAIQSSKLATDINIRGTLRIQNEDIRDYITAYHIGFGG
jgi:hypothetical protein